MSTKKGGDPRKVAEIVGIPVKGKTITNEDIWAKISLMVRNFTFKNGTEIIKRDELKDYIFDEDQTWRSEIKQANKHYKDFFEELSKLGYFLKDDEVKVDNELVEWFREEETKWILNTCKALKNITTTIEIELDDEHDAHVEFPDFNVDDIVLNSIQNNVENYNKDRIDNLQDIYDYLSFVCGIVQNIADEKYVNIAGQPIKKPDAAGQNVAYVKKVLSQLEKMKEIQDTYSEFIDEKKKNKNV